MRHESSKFKVRKLPNKQREVSYDKEKIVCYFHLSWNHRACRRYDLLPLSKVEYQGGRVKMLSSHKPAFYLLKRLKKSSTLLQLTQTNVGGRSWRYWTAWRRYQTLPPWCWRQARGTGVTPRPTGWPSEARAGHLDRRDEGNGWR